MLLLIAASVQSFAPPVRAAAQAKASVRIEQPATASRKAWDHSAKGSRREIVVRDEQGRRILVRVIEYQ
jgi:hypothetical protein